jgi:hypothetical protein
MPDFPTALITMEETMVWWILVTIVMCGIAYAVGWRMATKACLKAIRNYSPTLAPMLDAPYKEAIDHAKELEKTGEVDELQIFIRSLPVR